MKGHQAVPEEMGSSNDDNNAWAISKLLEKAKEFVAEKLTNIPKPEATVTEVSLKDVNRDSVDLKAKVSVNNPYPHPLPICQISYVLNSATRAIASGTVEDAGSLKGNEVTMIEVPMKVPYSIIVSLARDIGADWDIDYELELGFTIDIPLLGDITIPYSSKGAFKLPTLKDLF